MSTTSRTAGVGPSRTLFVSRTPPHRPFVDAQILNTALKQAFEETGIEPPQKFVGSHLLRHSLATDMLRKGASFDEIGDVLRHRSRMSTTIYARHDIDALRSLAPALAEREKQERAPPRRCAHDNADRTSRRLHRRCAAASATICRSRPASCVASRAFADREGADHITVDLFLRWKRTSAGPTTTPGRIGSAWCAAFAGWLQGHDARTEVPPAGFIVGKLRRSRPYIYPATEVATHRHRRGELPVALWDARLDIRDLVRIDRGHGPSGLTKRSRSTSDDIDLEDGVITVRRGKNGTARYVPLAPSTVAKLRAYRAERTSVARPDDQARSSFSDSGARPTDCSVRYNFALVSQDARPAGRLNAYCKHGRGPRIHDLRHTFAVRTIIGWYRKGLDPDREMIKLSTYLGHAKPEPTYWYIEAVPELLQLASQRAERALAAGKRKRTIDEDP